MTQPSQRDIPLPTQRAVRRRCGFGCVVCGLPLYEYDHLDGWAATGEHDQDRVVLLCDRHHRERTNGLLTVAQVESANQDPFNFRTGVSHPYDLHYAGSECEAVIGSNRFTTADQGYGTLMVPVSIDDIPLVGFVLGDGHLLLHLNLFDDTNRLILQIQNNRLSYVPDTWDIQLTGRQLIVRDAPRRILVDIEFEVPNRIHINRGRFLCNGVEVLVRPDHVLVTNNAALFSGNTVIGGMRGIAIGPHRTPLPAAIALESVSRYQHDPKAAIAWAREMMA
jgi:trigger factor